MMLPSVISALTIFYTLLSAALLLPLVAGLYNKSIGARSAIASIVTSVVVTFALEVSTKSQGVRGVPSLIIGVLAGGAAMTVVNAFASRSSQLNQSARSG